MSARWTVLAFGASVSPTGLCSPRLALSRSRARRASRWQRRTRKAARRACTSPTRKTTAFASLTVTCARTASAASRVESRDRGRTCMLARTDGELSTREQRRLRAGRSPAPARSCLCASTTSAASPCFRSAATFCAPSARRAPLRVALPGRVASRSGRGAAGLSSCSSQRAARRGSAVKGGSSHRECRCSLRRASRAASHLSARRPIWLPTLSWTPLPPTRSYSRRSIEQLARLRRLYSGRLSAAGRGAGAALRSPAFGELPSRPSASSCPLRARCASWFAVRLRGAARRGGYGQGRSLCRRAEHVLQP
mmetsp:Transcript_46130/g.149871  ORF Transcript_46130/g.149871 Transcript_46130/m.149871 type:complete len:309 (-) Transcript_46130:238-1164(-)